MLNEKLADCFELLDQIQKTYRNYNDEYIKILNNYPNVMDGFYEEFEVASFGVFKRFPEEQKERIEELYTKETEQAQAKLEKEALRKYNEDKKAEEAKAAEDEKKKAADPKAKKAAPKGKGKDDKGPQLDVPKLEVPPILEYESKMGQKLLYERSMSDIAEKLMKPAPSEEEENTQDADATQEEGAGDATESGVDVRASGKSAQKELQGDAKDAKPSSAKSKEKRVGKQTPATEKTAEEPTAGDGEEEAEEEKKEEWLADVVENDFIEKASMLPPKDPEGDNVMVPDLILTKDRIVDILEKALEVVCDWLIEQKSIYNAKAKTEGKQLQDQSVEELDENLRKQWPRKGRLEVEVYQERKSQITNHNRKYERQVRTCLEKYNNLEESWGSILDVIEDEFTGFQAQFAKLKDQLP